MLSQPDGPFINVAKLNLAKYAQRQNLAKVKVLFKMNNAVMTVGNFLDSNAKCIFIFFLVPF